MASDVQNGNIIYPSHSGLFSNITFLLTAWDNFEHSFKHNNYYRQFLVGSRAA